MFTKERFTNMRLDRTFFEQPTLKVAETLIGQVLCWNGYRGVITETEAYTGINDPACHAARGKTLRNAVMFENAGLTYVYFIYGMYYCLNIVTEPIGIAAAVLLRGIQLLDAPYTHLNGPGKLCRFLQITREHNHLDLTSSPQYWVEDQGITLNYKVTPRIGIRQGQEHLWRFVATENYPVQIL